MIVRDQTERLEREAEFQDDRVSRTELRSAFYGSLFDRVKEEFWRTVASAAGPCVVEVGCGPGENLGEAMRRLAGTAETVVAVDLSWDSLRHARADVRLPGSIRYVRADAEHLCLRAQSVDLAYGLGILHHLRRPAIYEELHRVLRPGGRAVFLEPLAGNWFVDTFRRVTPRMRSPFETPLRWREWEATGTPLRVRHREFLLTSLAGVALALVAGHGALTRVIDAALWDLDAELTRRRPSLSRWCWLSILEFRRPER